MKQEYRIFTGENCIDEKNIFWAECEEKKIVNLYAVKKQLYSSIEWDYYTLTKYLKINSTTNCTFYDEIFNLYKDYNKKVTLPKKQQSAVIGSGNGIFYVRNEDVENMMKQMNEIFDDMFKSNCLDITILEELLKDTPKDLLDALGYNS